MLIWKRLCKNDRYRKGKTKVMKKKYREWIITGILGNICGSSLCRLLKIQEPIAQGVAFGTASHVVGTSRASEISELTGAVSSLSLVVAGILTAIACPVLYSVL